MSEAETPTGVTIEARDKGGAVQNITEGVQALYDTVIQSMDWGSGFLSIEEVRPIVELATFCGFKGSEEAEKYMAEQVQAEKRQKCSHASWRRETFDASFPSKYSYALMVCDECGLSRMDTR